MSVQDAASGARAVIDSNSYMTLGTADANGSPWVSPVWFAHSEYKEFFWVSSPSARHSQNLASRAELAIVIFDSQVPPGEATAVYISASAEQVPDAELERGIEIFSRRSGEQGIGPWSREMVTEPAKHRLYRAVASEHFVLSRNDERIPVEP